MNSKITVALLAVSLSLAMPVMAQSTHPSESYPGKGDTHDTTNSASAHSPENANPSTGGQTTGSSAGKSGM
jgi:hypothetical protein